ncbi:MAG: phosphate/phosphite/phosphonate ABC transporter substrate-binding protein [Pseudomonadota bacterium]
MRTPHVRTWRAAAGALTLALAFGPLPADAGQDQGRQVLSFGVVPQQSASRLARMWTPLLRQLGQQAGVEVQFRTAPDIPTFEACLAAGHYDVAYMNPYHYTVFSRRAGYRALAHQTGKRLRGIIVVRKASDAQTIGDLDGQTVAFPSPGAFGASILPRAEMRTRGMAFRATYVTSHDSVYRAVAAGIVPAGGGVLRTLDAIEPELRARLRIIYRTDAYTPHAIAARPDLDQAVLRALQAALAGMAETAADALAGAGLSGLRAADDGDWDDVRRLSIDAADAGLEAGGTRACPLG